MPFDDAQGKPVLQDGTGEATSEVKLALGGGAGR
jgi:hypothetical protein